MNAPAPAAVEERFGHLAESLYTKYTKSHAQTTLTIALANIRIFVSSSESVGWLGLEPRTNALKGRCSTIELPTLGKRTETVSLKSLVASPFARALLDEAIAKKSHSK
jgi:hypothetical protein